MPAQWVHNDGRRAEGRSAVPFGTQRALALGTMGSSTWFNWESHSPSSHKNVASSSLLPGASPTADAIPKLAWSCPAINQCGPGRHGDLHGWGWKSGLRQPGSSQMPAGSMASPQRKLGGRAKCSNLTQDALHRWFLQGRRGLSPRSTTPPNQGAAR